MVGDPTDPATEVGPVVNESSSMDDILAAIERGRGRGRHRDRRRRAADDEAYLIAPTVFEGVADDAYLSCEEVFGPGHLALPLLDARRGDRARERRRVRPLGRDLHARPRTPCSASRASSQAGILHVNSQTPGADVHVPFGGIKGSGFGPHEQGRAAIEFYTELVTVYQDAPLG